MGFEEVLIPLLLRAGQMAVAMHFDAGEEGTRHRRVCVPLSLRQRRRPAAANLSILILILLSIAIRLTCVERSGVFSISTSMMLVGLAQSRGRLWSRNSAQSTYIFIPRSGELNWTSW
jgi:hypothetical protein